jgi:hypothetical protein
MEKFLILLIVGVIGFLGWLMFSIGEDAEKIRNHNKACQISCERAGLQFLETSAHSCWCYRGPRMQISISKN